MAAQDAGAASSPIAGRQVELVGAPAASPEGRVVLLTSLGLGDGDQVNARCPIQIQATGPRLLWQSEPTAWEPGEAHWAGPKRVVLTRRHAPADGSMAQ